MERPNLDIAFVSDVACPWCAIGLASFEQALARLKDEVDVRLHFEPFELNPDMGPEGVETVPYLMRKYGRTAEQVSCDHFVEPQHKLGNINQTHMIELIASDQQVKFGRDKFDTLPQYCLKCDVRFACHGACPKDRFITTPDGEPGLNYLCAGYKLFFQHIDQPMQLMVRLLRQNRAPAELMRWYADRDQQWQALLAKTGRNDPCP